MSPCASDVWAKPNSGQNIQGVKDSASSELFSKRPLSMTFGQRGNGFSYAPLSCCRLSYLPESLARPLLALSIWTNG